MERIVVRGGERLTGEVQASGSKNSSLALMAAALRAEGETRFDNVPRLRDVEAMLVELSVSSLDALCDEAVPRAIRLKEDMALDHLPPFLGGEDFGL